MADQCLYCRVLPTPRRNLSPVKEETSEKSRSLTFKSLCHRPMCRTVQRYLDVIFSCMHAILLSPLIEVAHCVFEHPKCSLNISRKC